MGVDEGLSVSRNAMRVAMAQLEPRAYPSAAPVRA
jgi:hypothetical protein